MKFYVRIILLFAVFYGFTLPSPSYGQDSRTTFEVSHQMREAERRAIVAMNLQLDAAEAEKFWPLYDAYRAKTKDAEKTRDSLIRELGESLTDMSNETADHMVSRALDLEVNNQKNKRSYISSLKAVLDGPKYFRYYQIETKLDAIFTYSWTKNIPLATGEAAAQ